MYITVTAQKTGEGHPQGVGKFVEYLEKENEGLEEGEREHFFDQYTDGIPADEVVREIDGNTAKLKGREPKFYSITVNPSKYELQRLANSSGDLKRYTRELMREYVKCFNREIDGRPLTVDDIKYYAKIEHQRTFKGTDLQVRENQPFAAKILELKHQVRNIQRGAGPGDIDALKRKIERLERAAPHQQDGKRIVQGMRKGGDQSHIHIIVSRKDASNRFSLSPGSKYKASNVEMHGKKVGRGFDRDRFFELAEKAFDRTFGHRRTFVETYRARQTLLKDPKKYFSILMALPTNERAIAFKILRESGMPMMPKIPVDRAQLALKMFRALKRGTEVAMRSGSIGI